MLTVARIIERVTTLLLTLVLASKLGAAGLGTYSIALAIYGAIAIAGEAGATMFLIRELATDKSRTGPYLVQLSALALSVSLVLTLAAELVVRHIGYSAVVQDTVAIVLLAIFPKTLNSIQEAVFVVHGRTEFETISTFVSSGLYLVISYWLLTHGHGVESLVMVYVALEYAVTVVYYILITHSITKLRWRLDRPLLRRLVHEIKSFTGSSALAALFARPEIIILSVISTPQQVGYYSAAVRISEIWLFVPEVFMNNVFPLLTRAYETGAQRFAEVQAKAIRYSLAYALPLTAGMVGAARPIIHALFGDGFDPSVVLLQLLAVNLTLFTLMGLFWRSVSASGRQHTVFYVQLIIVVTRLSIGTALITLLAALGAAIATLVNSGLHVLLLERVVRRNGSPARLIHVGWRFGVAAGIMGVSAWLASRWLTIWLLIPLATVLYGALAAALRAMPREDINTLRTLLPAHPALSK